MTTQNPRNQKPRSRWVLGCGGIFVIIFLIGLGVAAFILLRARLTEEVLSAWISAPVMDQQVVVNQPLSVLAGAAYPSGMSRVEVYADGALILAKDNTGQGETELSVTGTWIPLTSGRHVLLARGYASDDSYADSEVIYVDVTEPPESVSIDVDSLPRAAGAPNPSLDVIAQYLGTTADDLRNRNPDLQGIGSGDPLPSGSRVEGPHPPRPPREPSPPQPPRTGSPAAPTGLTGTADCTSVSLTWTASPGAESYRVYRLGARRDLKAEGLHTTTHRDIVSAPGTYRYQVSAVRSGREADSAVFVVSTPAGCTTIGAPPGTDLMLTAAMVDTDVVWDGIYCYIAVNDEAHNHIPEGDSSYLPPEASNSKYYNLTRLPGGGRWYLPTQSPTSPVTFFSECWGRRGPNSTILGSFLVSHPQAEWDGRLRSASGGAYRFTYCLGPSSTPCTPTVPGIATTSRDLSDTVTVAVALPRPTNLRRSTAWYCGWIGCSPTLSWNWTEIPSVPESSLTGYTVYRTSYDQSTGRMLMTNWWDVNRSGGDLPKRFLTQENDLRCGQRVMYRVLARQAALQSELSDPISFYTPRCATGANVVFTFDTLQVGTVNDTGEEYFMNIPDPARIADLEIQGYIYTVDGRADTQASTIRQSGFTDSSHVYSAYTLGQGTFRWSTLVNINSFSTLVLNNSQTLTVGAAINEVDTDWTKMIIRPPSPTPWCVGEVVLRARSLEAWGSLNEPFTINGGNAEAPCTITGRVVGTPVR